jgi:hypothetical protein
VAEVVCQRPDDLGRGQPPGLFSSVLGNLLDQLCPLDDRPYPVSDRLEKV